MVRVRWLRRCLPVAGWCAATLASIGVATVALQPVLRPAAAEPVYDRPVLSPSPLPSVAPPPSPSPSPSRSRARGTSPSSSPSSPQPAVSTSDGWIVTTGTDGQPVYTRSFRLAGGQAVIRMTSGKVQLV